jgi:hypothetical protein
MKKIIKALEKQHIDLEELIQKREDKVNDASERWQESEACEDWEFKTEEIQNQCDELFNIIEELTSLA